MQARMRPFDGTRHIAMFHWIEVNVIDMMAEVPLVPNQVFPKTALPDAAFAAFDPACAPPFTGIDRTGESSFDPRPPGREIRVALRHRPDAVEVIGQNHDRIDVEWMSIPHRAKAIAQQRNVVLQQRRMSVRQGNGEEVASARNVSTPIFRHGESIEQGG